MLAKCILGSGIKNKQATKIENYNGYDIYYLKEWGEDELKFVMFDNHLFPISFNLEIIKKYLDTNPDIRNSFLELFNKSLEETREISLGLAEYFNRTEEALKAKEIQIQRIKEKERQRIEAKRQREKEEEEKRQQYYSKIERDFKEGKEIPGQDFIYLCKQYGVKVPLKTQGWALKKLGGISSKTYWYRGNKNSMGSTVIMKYAEELKKTLDDIDNLFVK